MFWKQRKTKRHAYILLEVVLALLITLTFTPNLLKDQNLCKKELDKLAFYDALESSYKELLFKLYYVVHQEYYDQVMQLDKKPCTFNYQEIVILNRAYPTELTLQRHEVTDGETIQLSAQLKVCDLPLQIHSYQSDAQHYLIQKYKP